jgi:hypothetical protein
VDTIPERGALAVPSLEESLREVEILRFAMFKSHRVMNNEARILSRDYLVVDIALSAFVVGYRLK